MFVAALIGSITKNAIGNPITTLGVLVGVEVIVGVTVFVGVGVGL
jgi:hypothetical protein